MRAIDGPSGAVLFKRRLHKIYAWYSAGFIAFVGVLALLERLGLPRRWIGVMFLLATVGLYAAIGIICRTTDATEYYVAGRRVPAMYNGMATAAEDAQLKLAREEDEHEAHAEPDREQADCYEPGEPPMARRGLNH